MIEQLRDYQKKAIEDTFAYLNANSDKNPCIVAPTGCGKSWIIAGICETLLRGRASPPRIIVLSHVKEILKQDSEKILHAWPDAPLGIYSAGLGLRQINTITIAGIQSIRNKAHQFIGRRVGLVIVDEAHHINNRNVGGYRSFINDLRLNGNEHMRVIGLTATPYRLGQGYLTDGGIFDDLLEPITIEELTAGGYLAPLRSKITDLTLDTDGVREQNGEYRLGELEEKVNNDKDNHYMVEETLRRAEGRGSILVFTTGLKHNEALRDLFREYGQTTEMVSGKTPHEERDRVLRDFKEGRFRVLLNMNVLTTGFDYPDLDCIVGARPTLSTSLYVQMAGRGMRLKSGGRPQECLYLDFAGNIARHGPITDVNVKKLSRFGGDGESAVKKCPVCHEAVATRMMKCPGCGYEFPPPEKEEGAARGAKISALSTTRDIMGGPDENGLERVRLRGWHWGVALSRRDGTPMIRVDFLPENMARDPVPMYLCLAHGGYAAVKARRNYEKLLGGADEWDDGYCDEDDMKLACDKINSYPSDYPAPFRIITRKKNGYPEVLSWSWGNSEEEKKYDKAVNSN